MLDPGPATRSSNQVGFGSNSLLLTTVLLIPDWSEQTIYANKSSLRGFMDTMELLEA